MRSFGKARAASGRARRLGSLLVLAAGAAGCHARALPQPAYGYLVVGYEGRAKYGLGNDTVAEARTGQVPDAVAEAARAFATGYRHDPACNRFFPEGPRFLLLSRISCVEDRKIADGMVLTRIDAEGRVVGPTFGWITHAVLVEVQPYLRPDSAPSPPLQTQ
jgi:hypothetical protein